MGTYVDYRIVLSGDKEMMLAVAADSATAAEFDFDKGAFEQSGCLERNEDGCEFDVRWCGSDDTPELEVHLYVKSWESTEEAFHEILLAASAANVSARYLEWTDDGDWWWTKCVAYENGEAKVFLVGDDLFFPEWELARDAGLAKEGDRSALERLVDAFVSPELDDEYFHPTRVGLLEIIREAGSGPRPEHAGVWMEWAEAFRDMAEDEDNEMCDPLQEREGLIEWMESIAAKAALSTWISTGGTSARQSATL